MSDFKYSIDESYNHIIDEKGNTFLALRKIAWGDSDNYRLDLRKYYNTEEGERMAKGVSMSDEAADELVNVLTSTGYGNTKEIIDNIKNRDEFFTCLSQSIGKDNIPETDMEVSIDEMYDPREVFGNED